MDFAEVSDSGIQGTYQAPFKRDTVISIILTTSKFHLPAKDRLHYSCRDDVCHDRSHKNQERNR